MKPIFYVEPQDIVDPEDFCRVKDVEWWQQFSADVGKREGRHWRKVSQVVPQIWIGKTWKEYSESHGALSLEVLRLPSGHPPRGFEWSN